MDRTVRVRHAGHLVHLVHLRTVPNSIHARVLAARLGADGIVTELTGNVGSVYPFGAVSVWVTEADAPVARQLLLADEIEAVFAYESAESGDHEDVAAAEEAGGRVRAARPRLPSRRRVLSTLVLVLLVTSMVTSRLLG
jgi:hypothetical protein